MTNLLWALKPFTVRVKNFWKCLSNHSEKPATDTNYTCICHLASSRKITHTHIFVLPDAEWLKWLLTGCCTPLADWLTSRLPPVWLWLATLLILLLLSALPQEWWGFCGPHFPFPCFLDFLVLSGWVCGVILLLVCLVSSSWFVVLNEWLGSWHLLLIWFLMVRSLFPCISCIVEFFALLLLPPYLLLCRSPACCITKTEVLNKENICLLNKTK